MLHLFGTAQYFINILKYGVSVSQFNWLYIIVNTSLTLVQQKDMCWSVTASLLKHKQVNVWKYKDDLTWPQNNLSLPVMLLRWWENLIWAKSLTYNYLNKKKERKNSLPTGICNITHTVPHKPQLTLWIIQALANPSPAHVLYSPQHWTHHHYYLRCSWLTRQKAQTFWGGSAAHKWYAEAETDNRSRSRVSLTVSL